VAHPHVHRDAAEGDRERLGLSLGAFEKRGAAPDRGVTVLLLRGHRGDHPDARRTGQNAWRYVDLDAGVALADGNSTGWDLAMCRCRIRGALAVADLGRKPPPGAGDAAPVTAHLPSDRMVGR
jgi:hypothetical protein